MVKQGSLQLFGYEGTSQELLARLVEENRDRLLVQFTSVSIGSTNLPVPEGAYAKNRQQYKAQPFLKMLRSQTPHFAHALGLVDLDLFVPELNFIFGIAQYGGNALVALPRLRNSFYGLPDDIDLFFQRTVKEVFHELGHVFGLQHCTNDCVMQFSNSLSDTDNKPDTYCSSCLMRLKLRQGRF